MANSDGGTTPESLGRQVRDNVQAGCKDVFLCLSGHGQPGAGKNKTGVASGKPVLTTALKGGPAAVITGRLGIVSGDGTPDALLDGDKVTPGDLEAILDAHPTIEFKIKIDSCFSGRFAEPLKRHRNLRVLELSTAANEVGYHRLKGRSPVLKDADGKIRPIKENPLDNPDDASYFTNANLHGLYKWARDPGRVQDDFATDPRTSFPKGLAGAFATEKSIDIVRTAGLTKPTLYVGRQVGDLRGREDRPAPTWRAVRDRGVRPRADGRHEGDYRAERIRNRTGPLPDRRLTEGSRTARGRPR